VTHAPKYYLQLINCKQCGLDLHKMQNKIKKIKIKPSRGQTQAHRGLYPRIMKKKKKKNSGWAY